MKLIKVFGEWINPDHIIAVFNFRDNTTRITFDVLGPDGCLMHTEIIGKDEDKVAEEINRLTDDTIKIEGNVTNHY